MSGQTIEVRWPAGLATRWHVDVCDQLVGRRVPFHDPYGTVVGYAQVVAARLDAPEGATTADALLVTVEDDGTMTPVPF